MNPHDIRAGRTYRTPQNWLYFVSAIERNVNKPEMVNYKVQSGPKAGTRGEAHIDDFARRVVQETDSIVVAMKGGL